MAVVYKIGAWLSHGSRWLSLPSLGSVSVKRGATTLIARRIVKAGWDSTFGELLHTVGPDLSADTNIRRVSISKNENFFDPVHQVDVSAPLYSLQHVCLSICLHLA